jgi:hypothetical protein
MKFDQLVAQKTGLQPQTDRFVGVFQGFHAWARMGPVADVVGSLVGRGDALGGLVALLGGTAGGMAKHDYVIELASVQLPGGSLRTPTGFLQDRTYQMRGPVGERTSSGVSWMDQKYEVCSPNPAFIQYVCGAPELQQRLQQWKAPLNLSWQGAEVWLELLDSPTRINSWFSNTQQSSGDMILTGMTLVAAAARATYARQG